MKDLGAGKKILGMRITRNKKNHKLTLSQGEYTEKVFVKYLYQIYKYTSIISRVNHKPFTIT